MVAPLDAKVTFEVEGEPITLRLNFRALALAKKEGVNLMRAQDLDPLEIATAVRCLAVQDHPSMSDEEAFAVVVKGGEAAANALAELFTKFGSAEGNAPKAGKAKT
jgi:hypothetical protein